jgi:hypothetical protein
MTKLIAVYRYSAKAPKHDAQTKALVLRLGMFATLSA